MHFNWTLIFSRLVSPVFCALLAMPAFSQSMLSPSRTVPSVSPEISRAADLLELRQFSEAEKAIAQGLMAKPRDAQWRFLEAVLFGQTRGVDEAISAFEALVDEFPELSEPHNNLAVLYLRQGQPQKARQALERAIRNRPDYALAYENLGDLYVQLAFEAYDRGSRIPAASAFLKPKRDHLLSLPSASLVSGTPSVGGSSPWAAGLIPVSNVQRVARKERFYMVELTTNMGKITLKLDAEKAPKTVENFLSYVKSGHFDGTIFHRVIDGFMIQGGGFDEKMSQKPTLDPVENEASNGLKNKAYTVAMARTSDPHSATAQFFINVADNAFLDFKAPTGSGWGYTVFGEVVEGKEVVDKIKKAKTANKGFHADVPVDPVVIQKAQAKQ
jgi:peptidyl-prolyl cis-trans isomerase B (cyclophilin B)